MIMSFNVRCQAQILSASGSEVKVVVLHPVHDKTSGIGQWNKNTRQYLFWLDNTLAELHQPRHFDTPLSRNHDSGGNCVVHWVRPFWPEASGLWYRVRVRSTLQCHVLVWGWGAVFFIFSYWSPNTALSCSSVKMRCCLLHLLFISSLQWFHPISGGPIRLKVAGIGGLCILKVGSVLIFENQLFLSFWKVQKFTKSIQNR